MHIESPFKLPISILLFPGLDFVGVVICINIDLLVEIRLDKLEVFPDGLDEDVI